MSGCFRERKYTKGASDLHSNFFAYNKKVPQRGEATVSNFSVSLISPRVRLEYQNRMLLGLALADLSPGQDLDLEHSRLSISP
ncbi:hypothetical protein RRG08_052376 [Elysia crispata]|uniref:Uncharacterized protein n=1 Tax=Elysia crispata TaxID=231223 RepID=A0AAE1A8F0_9GAST|nr:hypothetical protein RRG08_052376 [Elysia crispata]